MRPIAVGLIVFLLFYVPIVGFLYGRQGRWPGAAGWSLFVAGVAGFAVGLASDIPWGGLLFGMLAAMGLLLIVIDLALRPRRHS